MTNDTLMSTLTIQANTYGLLLYAHEGKTGGAEKIVGWLGQHGPAKAEFVPVRLTAPADLWVDAGFFIAPDGTVRNPGGCSGMGLMGVEGRFSDDLRGFLRVRVAEAGPLAEEYDAAPMLRKMVADLEQRRANERLSEERRCADLARGERVRAEREAADKEQAAREAAERTAWIAAHGSERLRRCESEGIECGAIYRDERLEAERPGWVWLRSVRGDSSEPRNPPAAAFALLDEARKTAPDAALVYITADEETDEDGDVTAVEIAGYAAMADFLGRKIVLGDLW